MNTNGATTQECLDKKLYTEKAILIFERIFGHTWVSTGGEKTTKEFLYKLNLEPGKKVLDVGCGTGGGTFCMARYYGTNVHAVDLSANMIDIAKDRLANENEDMQRKITFDVVDVTKVEYENESYDVIYSRDTILHIADKEALYRKLYSWLKPGGILFVTDYCTNDQPHSQQFLNYSEGRGYDLRSVKGYGKLIEQAGFKEVQASDITDTFVETINDELKFMASTRKAFIKDYSEKDYTEITDGWKNKLIYCSAGDLAWGMFLAKK